MEKNRTADDLRTNKKTCPEESIAVFPQFLPNFRSCQASACFMEKIFRGTTNKIPIIHPIGFHDPGLTGK